LEELSKIKKLYSNLQKDDDKEPIQSPLPTDSYNPLEELFETENEKED